MPGGTLERRLMSAGRKEFPELRPSSTVPAPIDASYTLGHRNMEGFTCPGGPIYKLSSSPSVSSRRPATQSCESKHRSPSPPPRLTRSRESPAPSARSTAQPYGSSGYGSPSPPPVSSRRWGRPIATQPPVLFSPPVQGAYYTTGLPVTSTTSRLGGGEIVLGDFSRKRGIFERWGGSLPSSAASLRSSSPLHSLSTSFLISPGKPAPLPRRKEVLELGEPGGDSSEGDRALSPPLSPVVLPAPLSPLHSSAAPRRGLPLASPPASRLLLPNKPAPLPGREDDEPIALEDVLRAGRQSNAVIVETQTEEVPSPRPHVSTRLPSPLSSSAVSGDVTATSGDGSEDDRSLSSRPSSPTPSSVASGGVGEPSPLVPRSLPHTSLSPVGSLPSSEVLVPHSPSPRPTGPGGPHSEPKPVSEKVLGAGLERRDTKKRTSASKGVKIGAFLFQLPGEEYQEDRGNAIVKRLNDFLVKAKVNERGKSRFGKKSALQEINKFLTFNPIAKNFIAANFDGKNVNIAGTTDAFREFLVKIDVRRRDADGQFEYVSYFYDPLNKKIYKDDAQTEVDSKERERLKGIFNIPEPAEFSNIKSVGELLEQKMIRILQRGHFVGGGGRF